jgi:hypothetical protein
VEPTGSGLYAEYLAELITREDERKASLESRGVAVVTTSGALATLQLALVAATKKAGTFSLPTSAHGWVSRALVFFTVAAVFALLTSLPGWYQRATVDDMEGLLKTSWNATAAHAEKEIYENRIAVLRSLRFWNGCKGYALLVAVIAEFGAVLCIALAVREAI